MGTFCADGVRAELRAQRTAGAQEMFREARPEVVSGVVVLSGPQEGREMPACCPHWGSLGRTVAGLGERGTLRGSGASKSTSGVAGAVGQGHSPLGSSLPRISPSPKAGKCRHV